MEELIKLYESGKTLSEVSLLTGIPVSTVYKKLKSYGVSFRIRGSASKDISKKVYNLYLEGMNLKQISKELNVCYDTVKKNSNLILNHINSINNKIEEMYIDSKSVSEIHYELNISKSIIRRVLKSKGIDLQRKIKIDDKSLKYEYLNGLNMMEISRKYCIPHSSVSYRIKKLGIGKSQSEIMRSNSINHNFFNIINKTNSYWAGFLAADGCILKTKLSFTIKSSDSDAIYKFSNSIGFNNKFYSYKNQFGLAFGSEQICCDLYKNFNITEKKSLTLEPPNLNCEDYIRNFIRGYLDGDGFICKTEKKVGFAGTKNMLTWVNNFLNKYCESRKNKIGNKHKIFQISYGGCQTNKILKWLYKDSTKDTRLDRKYKIAREKYDIGESII